MANRLPFSETTPAARVWAAGVLMTAATLVAPGYLQADTHSAAASPSAVSASEVVLYEAGVHYEELLVPVSTNDPDKVEVVEMFSYLCIHCFNFDAAVSEWASRQEDGVAFNRIPAIFSKDWAILAQAFYTAEALGVSDKVHDPIFEAVHTFKQDVRNTDALAELFERVAGVEKQAFLKAYNSFSVRSKVQQANSRARQVRLQSVPTLVVNGKYKTNSSMAGTNVGMLQVVDFLIKKEQAAAASAEAPKAPAASSE